MEKIENPKESKDSFLEKKKSILRWIVSCDNSLLTMNARYFIKNVSLENYENIGLKMTRCDVLNILEELKETLNTTIESYKNNKLSFNSYNNSYHLFGFNQLTEGVIGHRLSKMPGQEEGQDDIILKIINTFIEIKEVAKIFFEKFPDENSSLDDDYTFSKLIFEKLSKLDKVNENALRNYLDLCQEFPISPSNAIKERILNNLNEALREKINYSKLIDIDYLNNINDFKSFYEEIVKINSELLKNDDSYFIGKRLERILNNVEVHKLLNSNKD